MASLKQAEVPLFFKNARRIGVCDAFTILAAPKISAHAKLLVVTSRAVGNSVQRHLVRRRIKNIFQKEGFDKILTYDIAVIVRKPAVQYTFVQIKDFLCGVLGN